MASFFPFSKGQMKARLLPFPRSRLKKMLAPVPGSSPSFPGCSRSGASSFLLLPTGRALGNAARINLFLFYFSSQRRYEGTVGPFLFFPYPASPATEERRARYSPFLSLFSLPFEENDDFFPFSSGRGCGRLSVAIPLSHRNVEIIVPLFLFSSLPFGASCKRPYFRPFSFGAAVVQHSLLSLSRRGGVGSLGFFFFGGRGWFFFCFFLGGGGV